MIICKNVIKEFGNPPQRILNDLTFTIESGEFVAISGRSGSGKSTLLYIISSLDLPSFGSVSIMGEDISKGVIDKNNQVFGYKNMFVCDGAMISANPGVNPSLSITAISEHAMSKIPTKTNNQI